jgi:hypothetical protein
MNKDEDLKSVIEAILKGDYEESTQILTIIADNPVDAKKVDEWWSAYMKNYWADKINEKIKKGFVTVRIQTEYNPMDGYGPNTMIYMAKMKKE